MRDRWGAEQDSATPDIRRTPRWIAATVMFTACAGFVGLAYYAYNAGTRVMRDDEVALVEPDTAPVKEKPANPGGMQFPNQDKTIFQAASNQPQKAETVERVLPAPEEPVNRQQIASNQSKDWINEKLSSATDKTSAQQPTLVEKKVPDPAATKAETAAAMAPAAGGEAAPAATTTETAAPAAAQPAAAVPAPSATAAPTAAPASPPVELKQEAPAPAAEEAPAAQEAPAAAPEKPAAKTAVAKKPATHKGGKAMVQLGSYRSAAEAEHAWKKLRVKYKDLLPSSPDVEQANLGEKGVYYRLRAHVADPKSVCGTLVSKGQPCIVAK